MAGNKRVGLALAGIATASYFIAKEKNSPPRSRVFINGNVLTMNPGNDRVEAVAIERDKIIASGSNEKIKKLIRKHTKVTDLKGRTLIPGFVDAHSHFPGAGLVAVGADLNSPPIGGIKDIDELVTALKQKVSKTKPGRWIIGFGYDDTTLADNRHPDRDDLDRVSTKHPVIACHITFHMCALNSAALKLLGIDENTENPSGGVIRRDPATGRPTGVLEETATHEPMEKAFDFSLAQILKINREAVRQYAAAGVTTAQVGLARKKMAVPLAISSRIGMVPLRLIVWPDADMGDEIISKKYRPQLFETPMHHTGAIKLFADGSIQAYTAYLSEPYHVPFQGDESYRGYPIQSSEELAALVEKFHRAGLQVAIHGNGDAAIEDIIRAFEQAQEKHPRNDTRHIIIHAQTIRPDQLDRLPAAGVTPSFHAVHPYYWGDRHSDIFLGLDRAARISPMKTALEKNIRFSTHLDTPVVPMSPLFLAWCAANRQTSGGKIIGPAEIITPIQALRSITIDAAWQVFQEDNRGSIEKGKFADLVILSADPTENPETIKDIEVEETITGGKTVFKK